MAREQRYVGGYPGNHNTAPQCLMCLNILVTEKDVPAQFNRLPSFQFILHDALHVIVRLAVRITYTNVSS